VVIGWYCDATRGSRLTDWNVYWRVKAMVKALFSSSCEVSFRKPNEALSAFQPSRAGSGP
jgi:hypothetical protein